MSQMAQLSPVQMAASPPQPQYYGQPQLYDSRNSAGRFSQHEMHAVGGGAYSSYTLQVAGDRQECRLEHADGTFPFVGTSISSWILNDPTEFYLPLFHHPVNLESVSMGIGGIPAAGISGNAARGTLPPLTYGGLNNIFQVNRSRPEVANRMGKRAALLFDACEAQLFSVSMLTLMECNIVVVPLDHRLPPNKLEEIFNFLQIDFIVSSASKLPLATELKDWAILLANDRSTPSDPNFVILEEQPIAPTMKYGAVGSRARSQGQEVPPGLSLLLLTSGSTSVPKVVPITTPQLLFNGSCIAKSLHLQKTDVTLNIMPLFHIGGIACNVFAVLASKSSAIMCGHYDAKHFFRTLSLQEPQGIPPTWYYAVPTLHKAITLYAKNLIRAASDSGSPNLVRQHRLRFIRSGAAHLPHSDAVELHDVFGCPVLPTYSMSECMPVCSVPSDWDLGLRDVVGPPIGPSVRIAGPTGEALPFGVTGEVLVKGPGVIGSYLRPPQAAGSSAEETDLAQQNSLTADGWLRTGDTAQMSRNGWISLHGRSKEVAKCGGEQVSLHEVDLVLKRNPIVDVAVTFAVPNSFWGEEIAAAILCSGSAAAGLDSNEVKQSILQTVSQHLERFKIPKQIIFVSSAEEFPKTATGKLLRSAMASHFQVSSVDNSAQTAIAFDVESVDIVNDKFKPSKALHGVRFFVACWVVQHHVGNLPNEEWRAIRNFTWDMSIFMILAGLLLASSATNGVKPKEAKNFYISRLSATWPLYVLAVLYSIPSALLKCDKGCTEDTVYFVLFVVNVLLMFTGFWPGTIPYGADTIAINGPLWFQAAYNSLVLLFPFLDGKVRKANQENCCGCFGQQGMFIFFTILASLIMLFFLIIGQFGANFSFGSWIPAFLIGIIAWHYLKKWAREDGGEFKSVWKWAIITDGLSIFFAVLLFLIAISPKEDCREFELDSIKNVTTNTTTSQMIANLTAMKIDIENTTNVNMTLIDPKYWPLLKDPEEYVEEYGKVVNVTVIASTFKRCSTTLGGLLGFGRLGTPLVLLWIMGLAVGHGLTAKLFALDIFSKHLAPLSYPLYLFHGPTTMYLFLFFGDTKTGRLRQKYPGIPYDVPWWTLLIVIPFCLLLGYLANEFLVPKMFPLCKRYWRWVLTLFACCCCCCKDSIDCSVSKEEEGFGCDAFSTESVVLKVLQSLTGTVATATTNLRDCGLDSFGTAALSGALKSELPDGGSGVDLAPSALARLETVQELVQQIDGNKL